MKCNTIQEQKTNCDVFQWDWIGKNLILDRKGKSQNQNGIHL